MNYHQGHPQNRLEEGLVMAEEILKILFISLVAIFAGLFSKFLKTLNIGSLDMDI
jgi:hypothetical protein